MSIPRRFERNLPALEDAVFDILVIGGGIAGACAAWDASMRGLSVALIEQNDFASGTSSNSLRIVHGGLRYLSRLEPGLAREAVRERSAWLRIAPHLVHPLPVLVPLRGRAIGARLALRAGLAAADAFAIDRNRGLPPERRLPGSRLVGREECLRLAPELDERGLTGGLLFHDAQLYNSEQLVLQVLRAAADAGAVVANYAECRTASGTDAGCRSVGILDRISGAHVRVRARVIVNATGPALGSVADRIIGRPSARHTIYSAALNLVVRALPHSAALALHGAAGRGDPGRHYFFVPWRERTLIGTAHLPYEGDPAHFVLSVEHVERFLAEVNGSWPACRLTRDDVLAVHGGLLPVHGPGTGAEPRLLRRHRVIDHGPAGAPDALSVVSVKFTSARLAAEEAVDLACARLGHRTARSRTARTPLPTAPAEPMNAYLAAAQRRYAGFIEPPVLEHLVRTYGRNHEAVIGLRDRVAGWADPVVAGAPVVEAQFHFGAIHEMAQRPDDLVHRRTELGAIGSADDDAFARAAGALRAAGLFPAEAHQMPAERTHEPLRQ